MQPHHTALQLDRAQWVTEQLDAARKVAVRRQPQQRAHEELRVTPVLGVQAEKRRIAGTRLNGSDCGRLAFDSPCSTRTVLADLCWACYRTIHPPVSHNHATPCPPTQSVVHDTIARTTTAGDGCPDPHGAWAGCAADAIRDGRPRVARDPDASIDKHYMIPGDFADRLTV